MLGCYLLHKYSANLMVFTHLQNLITDFNLINKTSSMFRIFYCAIVYLLSVIPQLGYEYHLMDFQPVT